MFENLDTGGAKEKYRIIQSVAEQYPVTELSSLLDVSRSGYYRYLSRQGHDKDQQTKERIEAIYKQRNGTYGYRRIEDELEVQYGEKVGDDRLFLSAIKDLCTKEIVAHHISRRNDNELVLETFKTAFEEQKDATGKIAGLIVHSDQGFQYTSHAYHDMLPTVGAQISMSRRGNCLDNAAMESFFSHLKAEALYPYDIRSLDEAQRRIEEFIQFYNNERIQRKLKKLTPVEYRYQLAA